MLFMSSRSLAHDALEKKVGKAPPVSVSKLRPSPALGVSRSNGVLPTDTAGVGMAGIDGVAE